MPEGKEETMEGLKICLADPAGNVTALVLSPVERARYSEVAQKLMRLPELGAEQVGYVTSPRQGGCARLEMMGGEFCGNAARAFGLLEARRQGMRSGRLEVEVSGCATTVAVQVDVEKGWAAAALPLPFAVRTLAWRDREWSLVCLPGIWHLVLPGVAPSREVCEELRASVYAQAAPDALGMLFVEESPLFLRPAVYVRETGSVVWENSCGSGSVAAAVWLSRNLLNVHARYDIPQPGGDIAVWLTRQNGAYTRAVIGGDVALGDVRQVRL